MTKEEIKAKLANASIAVGILGVLGAIAYLSLSYLQSAIDISFDDEDDWFI